MAFQGVRIPFQRPWFLRECGFLFSVHGFSGREDSFSAAFATSPYPQRLSIAPSTEAPPGLGGCDGEGFSGLSTDQALGGLAPPNSQQDFGRSPQNPLNSPLEGVTW